ncbi:hypothetical protein [Nostoc sp. WHI]|nr:hypothetical protein [Nostoc sp. WHI]
MSACSCTIRAHLRELKRSYLTEVEEKLLGLIEKEYGIIDEVLPNSR